MSSGNSAKTKVHMVNTDNNELLLVQATGIQTGNLSPNGMNNFAFHQNAQKLNPYVSPDSATLDASGAFTPIQGQTQLVGNAKG